MVPYQEEPESQVEPPLHGFVDDMEFPPRLARNREAHQEQRGSDECISHGSRGTTPEYDGTTTQFESATSNGSTFLIEETQFVDVELDTQGTDQYDISPTTRRAMNNMVVAPITEAPPVMQTTFLERKPAAGPDFSSFRFGVPPKSDSLKLSRPLPGNSASVKQQGVSLKATASTTLGEPSKFNALPTVTSNLPRRGELANGVKFNSNEQTVEIDNSANGRASDASFFKENYQVPYAQDGTVDASLNTKTQSGHISPRKHVIMGPPFQEVPSSLSKRTAPSHLPVVSLINDSSKPPSHKQADFELSNTNISTQAALKDRIMSSTEGPEFISRARDMMPVLERQTQSSNSHNIEKPEANVLVPAESARVTKSAVKKLIEAFGEDALTSGTHTVADDTHILETHHRAAPGNSYDRPIPIDVPQEDTSQQILHSCLDQNRSSSNGLKVNGPRVPKRDGAKLLVNRPLQVEDLQSEDADDSRDLQATRRSKVTKKSSTRTKESPNHQATGRILPTARGTISSVEMLQMVTVMANAEHERLDAAIAANKVQEDQLKAWNEEEAALKEYVTKLEFENDSLMATISSFDKRAVAFKDHCNEVVRAQKQLRKSADEWHQQGPHILKQIREEVDAIRDTAEENTQIALGAFSRKTTEILKEARFKLDSQEQTIEVLKCDLNNRILDLQRERRVAESLRKQLDENRAQHEIIKSLLLQHHANTTSALDVQQAQITQGLDGAAEQKNKMDEFQLMISGIKESEAKTLPALEGLRCLLVSLSTTVEGRVQSADDNTTSLRKAGEEVLAELSLRLQSLSINCEACGDADQRIESLVEQNATLKERVLGRERECANITDRLNDTLKELELSRSQLSSTRDKLKDTLASPPEDPVLRGQLLDLRDRNSTLSGQLAASVKEVEKCNMALGARTDAFRLIEEQMNELHSQLDQREAKISSFEADKEAFGQEMDMVSKSMRMQMERDFQARLADDEARHCGIVSSLRRQICEHENKAVQLQAELDTSQQISSHNAGEAGQLRADIAVLEIHTAQQAAELNQFEEELHSKGEGNDSAAAELSQSREQIARYEREIDEWRAQAQTRVSVFTKRYNESDERIRKADMVARQEINGLEDELNKLRKEVQDQNALKAPVIQALRKLGVFGHARSLEEFVLNIQSTPLRRLIVEDDNHSGDEPSFSRPHSPSHFHTNPASTNVRFPPRTIGPSTSESSQTAISTKLDRTYTCLEAGNHDDLLPDIMRSSSPIQKWNGDTMRGFTLTNSNEASHPTGRATTVKYQNTATGRSADDSRAHYLTNPERRSPDARSEKSSKGGIASSIAPSVGKHSKIAIPGSREEMTQNERPRLTRPIRRIAERKASMISSPRTQEANRTVTRTKVTEYSVKLSNTYEPTADMLKECGGSMASCNRSAVNGVNSSSPLSSPPTDIDFSEFLEEFELQQPAKDTGGQQGIGGAPQTAGILHSQDPGRYGGSNEPQASRSREDARARDMPPPKSILKRTKTQSVADLQPANVPNVSNKTGGRKRLAHIDGPKYSPYNRIVSGTKDTDQVSQADETRNHQGQRPVLPPSDVYTVDPSTVRVPPLGSMRKRSLSSVEDDGHRNYTKLQRLNRP